MFEFTSVINFVPKSTWPDWINEMEYVDAVSDTLGINTDISYFEIMVKYFCHYFVFLRALFAFNIHMPCCFFFGIICGLV